MKHIIFFLAITLFYFNFSYAQNSIGPRPGVHEVGNGGYGIICKQGKFWHVKDFTLLSYDLWESNDPRRSWKIRIINSSHYKDIVIEILKDLVLVDKERALKYRHWVELFESQTTWTRKTLPFTNDLGKESPNNNKYCKNIKKVQIIRQFPSANRTKLYEINKPLWESLELSYEKEVHKAALLLHEIIYREFYFTGHINSAQVRRFVQYLFSKRFQKSIHSLKLEKTEIQNRYNTFLKMIDNLSYQK